jgi:ubiquinol-cytochrome c reductase cytochrome c subunit
MRKTLWVAAGLMVALAACAKNEEVENNAAAETAAPAPAEPAPAPAPANMPAGVTADMVSQGQAIFAGAGNCFTCHGMDAKGTALAPNLTDAEWLNIDGTHPAIVTLVKTGVATPKSHPAPMPAMGGASLTDDQVNQVAAYVWSLGGGK